MTPDERQKLKALLVATSMYYGQKLPDDVLNLYVEDLADLAFAEVVQHICEIRRDPKTTRCPLPAVIRARVCPEIDSEAEAVEAVSRIVQAVANIGPYRTEDARAFVGELGWFVVTREGGWQNVCQVLTEENIGALKAQWRQLAIAQHRRAKAGLTDAPALPTHQTGGLIDMTKLLPRMPG